MARPARARSRGGGTPTRLLLSARSLEDVLYRDELEQLAAENGDLRVALTLTRERPPGWTGYDRRVDKAMLAEVFGPPAADGLAFVCGPTRFVEAAASGLVALGYDPSRVRTERFGPTGG